MNKNKLVPAAIASTVIGALMLTGCSQEPSDGFKEHCKSAEGTIERENDNTLGMSSVGFGVPKPAASKPAQKGVIPKAPRLKATQTPNNNGLAFGNSKKRKSKGHDDNDFLCVKDGVLLFEEDE
jgi:hypothetical protein